jgi:DNA replication licensing factor MCM6
MPSQAPTSSMSSDAGFMMSDGPGRSGASAMGKQRYSGGAPSSSGRPRGPPSENMGAPSDDEGEGFADDHIPRRSRPTDPLNIPRVEDKIGLMIQEHFQDFIDG